MALLGRQMQLPIRPSNKESEWCEPYDDVFDKYIEYNHFRPDEIIVERGGVDDLALFFDNSNSSATSCSGGITPRLDREDDNIQTDSIHSLVSENCYLDEEAASQYIPGVKTPRQHPPLPNKAATSDLSLVSQSPYKSRLGPTDFSNNVSPSPSNVIRSRKRADSGRTRSQSRVRSGISKSPGKQTSRMTNSRSRSGLQDVLIRTNEISIEQLNFELAKCQMPLSPPASGNVVQEEFAHNSFSYANHGSSIDTQRAQYDQLSVSGSYSQNQRAQVSPLRTLVRYPLGLCSPSYSLDPIYHKAEDDTEPYEMLSSPQHSSRQTPWSHLSIASILSSENSCLDDYPRLDRTLGCLSNVSLGFTSQPHHEFSGKASTTTVSGPLSDHTVPSDYHITEDLEFKYKSNHFSIPSDPPLLPQGPIVYPGQEYTPLPSPQRTGRTRKSSLSASPTPSARAHPSQTRSRSLAHHRRTKSSSSSSASSGAGHVRAISAGFVNFTPDDSKKLLTGVAPSGSSKTKARREKEAAERRKKLSEAAVRAVREVGGDVRRLKEVGLDV